jgi:hypothetical protein
MAATGMIHVRLDEEVKAQATEIIATTQVPRCQRGKSPQLLFLGPGRL